MRIDCDGDVVLYTVDADGPSCHTGRDVLLLTGASTATTATLVDGRRPGRSAGR